MTSSMMVNISRQIFEEQAGRVMNGGDMGYETNGSVPKQVPDTSYWLPSTTRAQHANITARTRSALQTLLQPPPPLALVPENPGLETDSSRNGVIRSPWPPYLDEIDFHTPRSHSVPNSMPLTHPHPPTSLRPSEPQVAHQGFNLQQPTSNHYHVSFSNRNSLQQQPHLLGDLSVRPDLHPERRLHQRGPLQREMRAGQDLPVGTTRMSTSLPKESEKMHMINFAQEPMNLDGMRRSSSDQQKKISLLEGPGGSNSSFGEIPNVLHDCPDSYQVLQSHHHHQPPIFPRIILSTAYDQQHDQNTNIRTSHLPASTFMMERALVDDADEMVIKRFQENVAKLDIGTRLGLQQSLLRLAKQSRKRQHEMGIPNPSLTDSNYSGPAMGMDLDPHNRTASLQQSRGQMETQANPDVDRNVEKMLFLPLRLPGLKTEPQPQHRPTSSTKTRAGPAGSSQESLDRQTFVRPRNNNWPTPAHPANSSNIAQTQILSRGGGPGRALEPHTNRTVTPFTHGWTDSPRLTDYASPPAPSSSPVDPSMVDHRQADVYGGALGSVAHAARQLGGNISRTTQPVNIQGCPRRSDSQSSTASEHSYSNHGGQALQFGAVGIHEPSNYGPQDAGSFVGNGKHIELASSNHLVDRHQTNQNFEAMMNMNADILGAAMSIQSRSAVDPIGGFHPPPPSSASPNSSTNDITVGQFSPTLDMLDDDGSHFQSEFRGGNLQGNTSMSTAISYFDQRNTSLTRSTVDTEPYTQPYGFYQS